MKKVFFGFYAFVLGAILLIAFGVTPLVNRLVTPYMEKQFNGYYQDLAKGVYALLIRDLTQLPQEAWGERIAELQADFGYPIALMRGEDAAFAVLTPEEMDRVRAGGIVVDRQGNLFHKQVPGSDYVLRMTTQPTPEPEVYWEVGLWALLACTLALFTLVWSIPFYRKLEVIRKAAVDFGNGRLQARVNIPARSSLAVIASAFNLMADRIVRLIDSHKDLIGAVSHELRTPVARIRFGLEMLACASDGEAQGRYAAGIQQDIDELDALVAELLAYNRFDHQAAEPQWEEHELIPWARSIVCGVAEVNEIVSFTCRSASSDEKATAILDPRFMGRALRNLLQNAARYAGSRVEVTVEFEANGDGEWSTIHVDDDGPGIAEQDRERVFEPFVCLDRSRDRESGGHGLGLAIVRQIATLHGGKATAGSSSLGGARFTLQWSCRPGG